MLGVEKMTVGLINQLKSDDTTPHLVSVGPAHKVSDALQMMKTYSISQLPVLEEGKSVGSLREGRIMAKLLDNRELMEAPVSEVMDRALPVVNEDIGLRTAVKYLKSSPALLVEEYGRIVGIVTRQDVVDVQG